MGDFLSPKRRDVVVDRLRRRLEQYRSQHNTCLRAYEPSIRRLYEQQGRETLLLKQKWLDSKAAKKAAKQSKTNKDSSGQNELRNHTLASKLRWKIDNNNREQVPTDVFTFDESDSPPAKKQNTGTGNSDTQIPSVSVQIVQQINNKREHSQTIHTNVTVSSTIKNQYGSNSSPGPTADIRTSTSVECKQEPIEGNYCLKQETTSGQTSGGLSDIGLDDVDEIDAILDELKRDEGDIPLEILKELKELPPEIAKELSEFDKIFCEVQRDSEQNDSSVNSNMFDPLSTPSPGLTKGVYQDPSMMGSFYESTTPNGGGVPTPPAQTQFMNQQTVAQSGPAAETLKHLAAQHQNQRKDSPHSQYPPQDTEQFPRRNGFNAYSQSQEFVNVPSPTTQATPYTYNQQPTGQYQQTKDLVSFGTTKPLSHFPGHQTGAPQSTQSSLQQLQNQVHSHFSQTQSQQMQVTQTQQLQISHGQQRAQLSQTQQLHLQQQPSQQVSFSQQQSFSVTPNVAQNQSHYISEQMKMQILQEKYRQEQQNQSQNQIHQGQVNHYMPPPEYKVPTKGTHYQGNNMGPNPLQTIQNMVNQTQAATYSCVKTEMSSVNVQGGMIPSGHSGGTPSYCSDSGSSAANFAQQMPQRPPSYPSAAALSQHPTQPSLVQHQTVGGIGQHPQGSGTMQQQNMAMPTRPQRQNTPTYTSTIMRNQRPPNVNVGPEGLNISQPRNVHDWPRPYMHNNAPRPTNAAENRTPISNDMMAQYSGNRYTNTSTAGHTNPGGGANNNGIAVMQMQGIRQANMTAVQGQSAMISGSAQVMMQQGMNIGHQVRQSPSTTQTYNMPSASSMHNSQSGADINSQTTGYSSAQDDDLMNFLGAQTQNPDFSSASDLNLLEEILGNK